MAKKRSTKKKPSAKKPVEELKHDDASRRNIPTAEFGPVMGDAAAPIAVEYSRAPVGQAGLADMPPQAAASTPNPLQDDIAARNPDLDPQLVWRGKADTPLTVPAPPLFIQEKVHPRALVEDLRRQSEAASIAKELAGGVPAQEQIDLFSDFNGLPDDPEAKTEFYEHDQHWTNRMILGDSLQVMASLAEREGLRGKVQCVYLDPPYGIKFNSNFQWSTTSRDVKDGKADHITREPEQVKAFRDTWRDGIHSYLTYLRDRLIAARDLLHESGSIFVQIGDENVHRVRAVMDEVFGDHNWISDIVFSKTGDQPSEFLPNISDTTLWYAKDKSKLKFRRPYFKKTDGETADRDYRKEDEYGKRYQATSLTSPRPPGSFPVTFEGRTLKPSGGYWKTGEEGFVRLMHAGRVLKSGKTIRYKRYLDDFAIQRFTNMWTDTGGTSDKVYVVQTATTIVQRCLLMATDPGDLVLDPTCGSGTTATVAEQWGRRWITIDTSRVALALARARARIMGARHPYYLLADSAEGVAKEAEITRTDLPEDASRRTYRGSVRQGFVYERVPHVTLKSIANNSEIDVIWEDFQQRLAPLLAELNEELNETWEEWEIPREAGDAWSPEAKSLHASWWEERIARQKEIDASIAAKADSEFLYDKPYEDKKKVRVAGPFTVESLSPHRVLGVDENDELIDPAKAVQKTGGAGADFAGVILEQLQAAGVQQADKSGRISFTSLVPWPGRYVAAVGSYEDERGRSQRAGVFIGPEFGTVTRADLVAAARETADAGFDVLVACAFHYEAHATEFSRLGAVPVLKARMNADLHMAEDLRKTDAANLFVVFGEPDIELLPPEDAPEGADVADYDRLRVRIRGVDVFKPATGKVESSELDDIACWFVDTDYNEESFFVRHAYFLGAADPYKSLRTTLKAEIDADAWATLYGDTSRDFPKPPGGRIAVKVINHLGDEVMKVFRVG